MCEENRGSGTGRRPGTGPAGATLDGRVGDGSRCAADRFWPTIRFCRTALPGARGAAPGGTAVSARDLTLDLLFPAEACWSLGAVVACAAALLLVERVAAQVHRYDALWHGLRAACVVATLALPLYCVSLAPVRPSHIVKA